MNGLLNAFRGFISRLDDKFLIQLSTFIVAVIILNLAERLKPGFPIEKRRDFTINLIALLIVLFIGEYSKKLVNLGYTAVRLSDALANNWFTTLPAAVKILIAVVLTDFTLYWVHRAMHKPFLWHTHSFHHSIAEIWWMAGARTSLTHLLLFNIPQVFIGYVLLRMEPWQMGISFSIGIFMNLWLHTNIWVNLGPIQWLFITPNYHRVHHVAKGYGNTNLGFVFTLWDRLFKTYVDPLKLGKDFPVFAVPTKKRLLRMIVGF